MTIDLKHLRHRADLHAALSDPARLAIVDALWSGDVSPSQLQVHLEMASNLLAHHLKVLEQAGILSRQRSEGDRRRTYLKLVRSSLMELVPGTVASSLAKAIASGARVVFVCTANSARSQLAEAVWRQSVGSTVASAGTHPAESIAEGAVAVARRHGMELATKRPRFINDVIANGDVVITVCDSAHEELNKAEAVHWSIPDPLRAGTGEAFDLAFDQITQRVVDLARATERMN